MTTIAPLPTPPQTNTDQTTFDARGDAFLAALPAFVTQTNTVASEMNTAANAAAGSANTANLAANAAALAANAAVPASAAAVTAGNAAAAAAATAVARAIDAAAYASVAQATNPDSPIRLNTRVVTADFTVGSNYNAMSIGPITIAQGVTLTVADNATYAIN